MSETPKYLDASLCAQERARDLVSRMTLEEKAGQGLYRPGHPPAKHPRLQLVE